MSATSKIKTARNLAGFTQLQLAEAIHVSESTIKRVEQGAQKADQNLLDAIAVATGCPWVSNPYVPDDYKPMTKPQAFVGLYSSVRHAESILPTMAEILADGKVDSSEKKDFERCMAVISKAQRAQADMCYAR